MNTMRLMTGVLAAALVWGCSGKAKKDDPTLTEETTTAATDGPPGLTWLDEAPSAEKVESADGVTEYQIGPIRLLHKLTPANPVVAARLYIDGGQSDLTSENAGIAKLAMSVATNGGTMTTPKDSFHSALDSTGASVWSFTDRDFNGYGLKTLVGDFDQNWELFEQAILEPAFPSEEVELRRTKHLAEIASLFESPDNQLTYVGARHMFKGHPYYNLHVGTKANVERFERDELLEFQRSILQPERFLFVVVGNVPAEKVIAAIRDRFGRLAPGDWERPTPPPFASQPGLAREARKLPTNYILGYFAAPAPGASDYPTALVTLAYLRERLFEEVRTKRNLTYAVSSGLSDSSTNYGYLYVTAERPADTLPVMFEQVEALKKEALTEAQLRQTVNVFLTSYYMDLEENGSQAAMLATAELVAGDWQTSTGLLSAIRSVTPEAIQQFANTYFKDYRFALVGPAENLPIPAR